MRYLHVLLALILLSCHDNKTQKILVVENTPKEINLVPDTLSKSLQQVIDTFWHVQLLLEDTLTPIKNIDKILVINGTIYVMDKQFNSIKAFDYDGKYKFDVGGLGMASGQYIRIMDIIYNKYKNTFLVLCSSPSKTIIEYSLTGKFLKNHRIPNASSSVGIKNVDTKYYFLNGAGDTKYANVNLVLCDSSRKIRGTLFDVPKNIKLSIGFTGGIYSTGDSVYFNPPLTNDFYSLSSRGTVKLEYRISFGKYGMPENFVSNYDLLKHIPGYAYLGKSFIEQSEYIGFNYITKEGAPRQAFYNKKSGNIAQSNTKLPLDYLFTNELYQTGDTIITATYPSRIKYWRSQNKMLTIKNLPLIFKENHWGEKNNNPVLFFYKLKPF